MTMTTTNILIIVLSIVLDESSINFINTFNEHLSHPWQNCMIVMMLISTV